MSSSEGKSLLLKRSMQVVSVTGFIVFLAFALRMAYLGRGLSPFSGSSVYGGETGAVAAAIASGRGFSSPLPRIQTGPTAWLTPIYPSRCHLLPWDTAMVGLCMAALVTATLKIRGSNRVSWWIGYGALWAFSAMAVLPFLALWAIWPLHQRTAQALKLAVMTSVVFLAGIAPWSIRNYLVFHKFIPFRSNFGLELWLSNNPGVPDTWAGFLHPTEDPREAAKYVRMTEIPYMDEKQSEAFAFMRTHPRDTMRFFFRRFADNWLGIWDAPADMWRFMPPFLKLTLVWNCLFSLLSFLGAHCAYRARCQAALPCASVMLMFPVVFYVTHTTGRYRYPMLPIMVILTVFAFAYLLSLLVKRSAGKLWVAESVTSSS